MLFHAVSRKKTGLNCSRFRAECEIIIALEKATRKGVEVVEGVVVGKVVRVRVVGTVGQVEVVGVEEEVVRGVVVA